MAEELIHREALERIIQRAAELQAGEREIGDGLTDEDVRALGKEVGIPDRYLRQALLEERIRGFAAPPPSRWTTLLGAAQVAAARVVPGTRPVIEQALERWMEEEELLQVRRRFPDHLTWEPRPGAFASIQRALGVRGKRYALAEALEVRGQVEQLEPGFCHVRLAADVHNLYRRRLNAAALLATFGVLTTGALASLSVSALLIPLPAVILGLAALAVTRRHRRENENVQVGLEQVLDRLERGEAKPDRTLPGRPVSAFVRMAEEIRRALD